MFDAKDYKKSHLEMQFHAQVKSSDLPEPCREYMIEGKRFDFAWSAYRVAAEIHGGTWSGGRHVRGKGFADDRMKMNAATLAGWVVLEFTADHLNDDLAIPMVRRALEAMGWICMNTTVPLER